MRNFARDSAPEKIRKVSKGEDAFVLETGPHDLIEKINSEVAERKSALDVALLQNNNVRKKKMLSFVQLQLRTTPLSWGFGAFNFT